MARKLTQQQHRRIQSLHEKRTKMFKPDEGTLKGAVHEGLLITHHGRNALIETMNRDLLPCHVRQNLMQIVTGDRVLWQANDSGDAVIVGILPRETVYTRQASGQGRPLAANITCLVIVFAPEPTPTPGLLDKYLVAAELSTLKIILILNKCDLLPNIPELIEQVAAYRALGYPVLEISTLNETGFETLNQALKDEVSVVVGQSGVGKSSLVKRLLPHKEIEIGAISHLTGFGRHTTSHSCFYHLPEGGAIIDTPGVRDMVLGDLTPLQIQRGFIECRGLIGQCRFRDCTHSHEPECAIVQAVECGKISAARYKRLLEFQGSSL